MLKLNYPGSKRYENTEEIVIEIPVKHKWFYIEFLKKDSGVEFHNYHINKKSYIDSDDGEYEVITVQELLTRTYGVSKALVLAILLSCYKLKVSVESGIPVDAQFIIHWIVENFDEALLFPTEDDNRKFTDWYMFSDVDSKEYLQELLKKVKTKL